MFTETWLVPAEHRYLTPNRWSGAKPERIKPIDGIIYHYTAGGFAGSLSWLLNPKAEASAHFIVAKNGRVVQLAPLEDRTWHAGGTRARPSSFLGAGGVNGRTWGIEIENLGLLRAPTTGAFIDAKGLAWEPYTEAQLAAVEVLTRDLVRRMPNADAVRREPKKYLTGHSDVDPRKIDPGPSFPWQRIWTAATCA